MSNRPVTSRVLGSRCGIAQTIFYVLAYMWSNLSAAQGDKAAVVVRDNVAAHMTAEQVAEAQRLSRNCPRADGTPCFR